MSNNKEYMRSYMLARYHRRREEVIRRLGGGCAVCGSTFELEIDHIDPKTKEVSWKTLAGLAEAKLEKEIKKCQLLCDKHHNEKSVLDAGNKLAEHGTITMYSYHGCRCSSCREAKTEVNKRYKKKRRLKLQATSGQ